MNNLNLLQKIKTFISNHKIWSIVFSLALICLVYFIFFYGNAKMDTTYTITKVKKGDIIVSVTGAGQIEARDTIDLKANTTGNISYVGVKVGDIIKKGKLIASVDSRDARLNLENAKITLEKLVGDPDSLSLLQKQNSLSKLYSDGWNNVSSFVVDMNSVISGLDNLHNDYLGSKNRILIGRIGKDKIDLSEKAYWEAKNSLDEVTKLYKSLTRENSNEEIKNLISKTIDTSKKISNAVKLAQASFDYVHNSLDEGSTTEVTTIQKDLSSWTTDSNSYVNNMTSSLNNIEESSMSLDEFLAGADELDIKAARLAVENRQEAYNDCFIYAPFDGTIATLTAKVGQSSGSSIGTLITNEKLATISLNEVDIAKIKLGQAASLTFDAIDNLTLKGKVAEIDSIGTVSQGVVTYDVAISLDKDDERVKPGMSVSATIISDIVKDTLIVPVGAIKTQSGKSYAQVFDSSISESITHNQILNPNVLPDRIEVEIGLMNDTSAQIISGLEDGDIVVTKTSTTEKSTTTQTKGNSAPSLLGAVGAGGGPRN